MQKINGKATINIIRNTLKLIDNRIISHGNRVGYILYKMLEVEDTCTKEQKDTAAILGMLHDIGAFKTDEIDRMLSYDCKNVWGHSIYGYLYLKYLSPLQNYSETILYHHLDYNRFHHIKESSNTRISMYLNIADRADILICQKKKSSLKTVLEEGKDTRFYGKGVDLFFEADDQYQIIEKLASDSYLQEWESILGNIHMSEEECLEYLKLLVYSIDFKGEDTVLRTVRTVYLAAGIGKRMNLSEAELSNLYYASLVYDFGMLGIPSFIINAPRKLTKYEKSIVMNHVTISEDILKGNIKQEIIDIVSGHHEKLDGTGYPRQLKEEQISLSQRILSASDITGALFSANSHKKAFSKEDTLKTLTKEALEGKLDNDVVKCAIENYNDIMEESVEKNKIALDKYLAIKSQFGTIIKRFERF